MSLSSCIEDFSVEKEEQSQKKQQKQQQTYRCEPCKYVTLRKHNFSTHCSSAKHYINHHSDGVVFNHKKVSTCNNVCTHCNRVFKTASGLWKHAKQQHCFDATMFLQDGLSLKTHDAHACKDVPTSITPKLIMEVLQQNKELQHMLMQQTSTIVELTKNAVSTTISNHLSSTSTTINSNNKTFNLQFFLNETCKDAMNIMEFVDSLKLQLSDLESMEKIGFVQGLSNIIVKNLNSLEESMRPVHCTDSKREVIYVKDDNKWEKENDDKKKMRKAIKHIAHKNSKLLPVFKSLHPDCEKSNSKFSDKYNNLIIEAMGGRGDNDVEKENKIIRNIAKEVSIGK